MELSFSSSSSAGRSSGKGGRARRDSGTIILTELECNGHAVKLPGSVTSLKLTQLGHSERHTFRIRQHNVHGSLGWSVPFEFETLKGGLQYCAQCGQFNGSGDSGTGGGSGTGGHSTFVKTGSRGLIIPKCASCGFGAFDFTTYAHAQ